MRYLTLNDVCTFENGELASVDLSGIYAANRNGQKTFYAREEIQEKSIRLAVAEPPAEPHGSWKDLFCLMNRENVLPALRGILNLAVRRPQEQSLTITVQEKKELPDAGNSVLEALPPEKSVAFDIREGEMPTARTVQSVELNVPMGMPRYVNVPTLRAMLGLANTGSLMHQVDGGRWEVCSESYMVDLENPKEVFRLGRVQILS